MQLLTQFNTTTAALLRQLPICQTNPWGDLEFWKVLAGITAVLGMVWLILQITNAVRRKPGLDYELGLLATKRELADMEARITKRGEDREKSLSSEMAEMRRALTAQTSNLHTRINNDYEGRHKESQQLALQLQSIYLALGKLEPKPGE